MYIHIGEDLNIRTNEIIAILDSDSVSSSKWLEELLTHHQDKMINLSKIPFKSVVVTTDKVYLSPIASGTLKKRSSHLNIQGFFS